MTVAVDANVILRLVLRDHEAQWRAAEQLFTQESLFVPTSVWLEVEWVMRSVYGLSAADFVSAARSVIGLANVEVADRAKLAAALNWHEGGLDFADAIHLAHAGPARTLATFDALFRTRGNALQRDITIVKP